MSKELTTLLVIIGLGMVWGAGVEIGKQFIKSILGRNL